MESADLRGRRWAGILLSASLLTVWSLAAAAQISRDAFTLKTLAKPTISVSQGTVIEHRENVTFYCDTPDVNITIRWVSNHQPLPSHERIQLSTDGKNLTILTVQRQDAGEYQCEAWDLGLLLVKSSDPTYLTVYYGPDPVTIKWEPGVASGDVVEVMEGSNVTFLAETESYPPALYSWYFANDSKPVSSLFLNTSSVTIHAVSKEHEGTYSCLVSNTATQLTVLGTVKVRVLKTLTKPYIIPPNRTLVEDTNLVVLTCQTPHEGVGVRWFLGDQLLLPSEHLMPINNTLVILGLRRNDTGPYACEVWNWGSRARSEALKLNISYGPDQVYFTSGSETLADNTISAELNSKLTLQCWAESQPGAEFNWTHDKTSVCQGEQLVIEALTWKHQGNYSCTASNSVTLLTCSASVMVRVIDHQSSLSAGAIAGITVGILAVIALAIGLGCFLHTGNTNRLSRRTTEDTVYENMTPTSEEGHLEELGRNWPMPVYANVPATQGQIPVKKMLPVDPPEQLYEQESPSTILGGYSHGPRKPSSKLALHPLVPTLQKENAESNYQVLVNPENNIYCQINRPT
ncbi:carcinoembryonic antigen-related cell adhesion molecule 20 isoform X2 [Cervus canadensis]|uniref:carcinoembryonic antigen-related cell adhesion molecule 20 isoform X2 n=1 Tax=Cervus canadensis TaxID=1574408 RepID=UPI001CA30D75|nr:carcinoembryonic antigen-related cell adhesion molecule 20 isoform X2 [Cervus canadensis]